MSVLTKDQILAAVDLPREEVSVPEWGGAVVVRGLTGKERDQFEASLVDGKDKNKTNLNNIRARLVALTLVDSKDNRLFSDEDVEKLGAKSAQVLDRLFETAQRLSGLKRDSVEELAGN